MCNIHSIPNRVRIYLIRSVIITKGSDGICDPLEKIAMKSHSDHSDSGIGKDILSLTLTSSSYCNAIR